MTDLAPTAQIWIVLGIALVVGVVAAYVIGIIASLIVRVASHRAKWRDRLTTSARAPFRVLVGLVSFWISLTVLLTASTVPESETAWRPGLDHTLRIAVIAAGAWLVVALIRFAIDSTLTRYPTDVADNRVARRITTQLTMIRRVAIAVIVIVALGAALLTFPGVQAVGASLLASAGVLSVVAGIAAQSTLANIFAGLQLAFTDALRVDDVVIVENEWGRIEEITLTYVVVHLWDDRRLVLPSTYFTTTPFQNWTRRSSELLGAVEIDLDWQISPAEMRLYLDEVLAATPLWDGRTKVLQVTEATGGLVRVRILVTAVDAPTLFDLRCYVREEFVEWLNRKGPAGLPRNRVQLVDAVASSSGIQEGSPRHSDARQRPVAPAPSTASDTAADAEKHTPSPQPEGLFSGSAEAEQRAATFTTPIDVIDRDQLERDNKRSEEHDR